MKCAVADHEEEAARKQTICHLSFSDREFNLEAQQVVIHLRHICSFFDA